MKKVLVTGATGFIGNYVVDELLKRGVSVIATSSNREKASAFKWFDLVDYIPLQFKNLSSEIDYYSYFNKPDVLIHLAWEGLPNYKEAFHLDENLPRHYLFLKNLLINGLKDITVTGTCFEYGMQEGCLKESILSAPSNSYGIAKNNLRMQLTGLMESTPFNLKWIRLFYMYGKGQSPNSLLSQLQSALDRGDEYFNMSPGDQIRDYLPVTKVAEYIVSIAMQKKETGVINCCSGVPISIKDLVHDYLKAVGKKIQLNLGYYPYSDFEAMAFWGDDIKLKKALNQL